MSNIEVSKDGRVTRILLNLSEFMLASWPLLLAAAEEIAQAIAATASAG